MSRRKDELRSRVVLVAYDGEDHSVLEEVLSFEDYYEELHPLIDEDEYRASLGVRRLTGRIYNSNAKLIQEFDNHYAVDGKYERGRAVHEDGTVIES